MKNSSKTYYKQQSLNTRLQTLATRLQTLTGREMSSGKWQTINGLRYQVEDNRWENPNEDNGLKLTQGKHLHPQWEGVGCRQSITLEEAMAIAR